jgi:CBS domain-containing protein
MKLEDICAIDAICCLPDITLLEASRAMRQNHVGDLIVVDDADEEREPIGIITDRDIVVEAVALGKDSAKLKVRDIMTRNVVVASASEDASIALERMRSHGVRRIPVVDDKGFVTGIVTLDDLMRSYAEEGAALAQVVSSEQRRETRRRR